MVCIFQCNREMPGVGVTETIHCINGMDADARPARPSTILLSRVRGCSNFSAACEGYLASFGEVREYQSSFPCVQGCILFALPAFPVASLKEITRPDRFFFSIREHTSNRSYAVDYSVLQYAARCDCAGSWY
jgi:hypothetical protein